uniref:Uncharacterized protein n=1 Tax=Strigamia maritima TaxID=126957 RepID=T1JMC4_STRMM
MASRCAGYCSHFIYFMTENNCLSIGRILSSGLLGSEAENSYRISLEITACRFFITIVFDQWCNDVYECVSEFQFSVSSIRIENKLEIQESRI